MNLASPSAVRDLLAQLGIHPSKALGQNFLIDRNTVDHIVEASEIQAGDTILEIGPGLGVLTESLLSLDATVQAIELDARLAEHLRKHFAGRSNFSLIHGDAVDHTEADRLEPAPSRVVSNLPYSAGTRILVALVLGRTPPPLMVVTVQQEVGDRMMARPESDDYGLLSIILQVQYDVRRVRLIKPTCFWPKPDVTSAVMVLTRKPLLPQELRRKLCHVAKLAFSSRRKQLHSLLDREFSSTGGMTGHGRLEAIGAIPTARPENLSPTQWLALIQNS